MATAEFPVRGRYRRTVGLALRFALQLWWLGKTRWLRPAARQRERERALYTRQGRRFREFATAMGGLIIKLGQFLSVRIDLLPKAYIDELSGLQDAVPPVATDRITAEFEAQLGRPVTEAFASFDVTPLAAASLGQVHRARLTTGEDVAVKVLRPGIEDLVDTDLRSLRTIMRWVDRLTHVGRMMDVNQFCDDFEATFRDELDYQLEGRNAETFQRNLLWNPHVDIPRIHWSHSSRRVLTMEFMDGVKISELETLDRLGIDRPALARNLLEMYLQMFLHDGFYHADPHPGNVFVRPDGVIQLIDFGMVGSIPDDLRHGLVDLIVAVLTRDSARVVAALQAVGFLRPGTDTRALRTHVMPLLDALTKDLGTLFQGTSFIDGMMQGEGMGSTIKVDATTVAGLQEFIRSQPIQLPGNTTFLGKALITIVSNCFKLDPTVDVIAVSRPFIEQETGLGWRDLVAKVLSGGWELIRAIGPTARHLVSLAEKLDHGDLEIVLPEAQLQRLAAARGDGRRTARAIAGATLAVSGTVVLVAGAATWAGVTLAAVGGLILLVQAWR
jgi:predicted unusual protein kinase regulating ubiquinone biosynthesis (AarF/ABC1/UbiB family)